MKHLKLTFDDIMQVKVLFYDKELESACFDICRYLKIDNLPAIDGLHFYELSKSVFERKKILNKHKVPIHQGIFDKSIIKQFKTNRHNVLFVFEENILQGVVHVSDYNRDILLQTIQDDILSFERKLRQLILLNGFTNNDMKLYFIYKRDKSRNKNDVDFYQGKINSFERRQTEIDSLGAFQIFEFSDLMYFAASDFTKSIFITNTYNYNGKKKPGSDILRELRNLAMHGKNPVAIDKETSIYSLESLTNLSESLNVLRMEYARVSNKIRQHPDFLRSIELDNRKKLEIIHDHHPKALQYFLGF